MRFTSFINSLPIFCNENALFVCLFWHHSLDSDSLLLKTCAEVCYFPSVQQFALVDVAFYFPQL